MEASRDFRVWIYIKYEDGRAYHSHKYIPGVKDLLQLTAQVFCIGHKRSAQENGTRARTAYFYCSTGATYLLLFPRPLSDSICQLLFHMSGPGNGSSLSIQELPVELLYLVSLGLSVKDLCHVRAVRSRISSRKSVHHAHSVGRPTRACEMLSRTNPSGAMSYVIFSLSSLFFVFLTRIRP
jgi:hypothetical protein